MKRIHPRQEKGPTFEELSDEEEQLQGEHHSNSSGSVRYEDPDDMNANHSRRHPRASSQPRPHHRESHTRDHDPFAIRSIFDQDPFFSNPFGHFSSLMQRTEDMFRHFDQNFERQMAMGDNVVCYSSTTTTTSSDGVTKTKRTVKDSRTGTEKVSVIKAVGDKRSVMEKTKDREGREEITKRLENVTEEEEFEKEWKERSKSLPKFRNHGSGASRYLANDSKSSRNKALAYENKH
ncbi:hypothetical protein C9374_011907 [Naegleria lovaniensis]|uniref:Myeloid leukemia factor 1 n=1 Tax=Naegleria lovaniensis TaxID=51637 RepID=A0AA88GEX8_NAELO|nr:uncharacterized protein C9374_011907 [Naegleria lovaniensis]KAG2373618.1 hypothetical protein C9374_011907 [Naegleria lovaniensis]